MAQRSLDLIEATRDIAEAAQPITGRGVGYELFIRNHAHPAFAMCRFTAATTSDQRRALDR